MHLVYFDESGNSGLNLSDPQQPIFYLCAMVVAEDKWQSLEAALKEILDARLPGWKSIDRFEVHGSDLRRGDGVFKGVAVGDRIAFRDAWMNAGAQQGVRLLGRSVNKRAYANWLIEKFGKGVLVNPHVAAFALLARCIDNYLKSLPGQPLGMFISDENKEIVADVEKSIRVLRGVDGTLRLGQIVEKGFFIDSAKSLPLQLCDLFTMSLRKREERAKGLAVKSFDDTGIAISEKLLYRDNQHDRDVLGWLASQGGGAK